MGAPRKTDFELPKRVYRRRGKLYHVTKDNRWVPVDDDPRTAADQVLWMEVFGTTARAPGLRALRSCFNGTKRRAGPRKLDFRLSWEDMLSLWRRSEGRCEISGIPFAFGKDPRFKNRPFAPSIDRIDNSLGYVPENCRLVCIAANLAVNEWGLETLTKIADGMRNSTKRRRRILDFGQSIRQPHAEMVPRGGFEPPT